MVLFKVKVAQSFGPKKQKFKLFEQTKLGELNIDGHVTLRTSQWHKNESALCYTQLYVAVKPRSYTRDKYR